MGFGTGNSYDQVFYLKMHSKKDERPYFEVKNSKNPETVLEPATFVEGILIDIKKHEFQWEDQVLKSIKFSLYDEVKNELYLVSCGLSMLTRSILNSLVNEGENIGKLRFSLYNKKDSGYSAVYVSNNGADTSWKYDVEFMKKKIDVITNKKGEVKSRDYDELDDFFIGIVENTLAPIAAKNKSKFVPDASDSAAMPDEDETYPQDNKQEEKAKEHEAKPEKTGDDEIDPLPF